MKIYREKIDADTVLKACYRAHSQEGYRNHWRSDDLLSRETGKPMAVIYAGLRAAVREGLVDYGVSLGTAWPTPEGMVRLDIYPSTAHLA